MRRLIVLGSLAIAIVVFLPFAGFLTARNVTSTTCAGDGISQPIIAGPTPEVPGLTDAQVRLAKIIWLQAHKLSSRLGGGPADQAAVIAIAVASQESTLGANPTINRPNSDGDAGPFQQPTIPGWYGTLAEVTDPTYAVNTFLLGHTVTPKQHAEAIAAGTRPAGGAGYHLPGLADVPDWAGIDIIDAADQVQHSAFPDAVADDIPIARELVAAFDGGSSNGLIADAVGPQSSDPCGGGGNPTDCPPSGSPSEARLKPDTLLVLRCVKQQFPKITTFYGYRPHDALPDHPSGRAVDIMISSTFADFNSPQAVAYGTKIADWVKAHHAELGVQYIIYKQRIWNVQRPSEGWRLMPDRGSPTANHMDHVHVTTYGDAAKPTDPPPKIISSKAVTPVEHYRITATFGEVGSWARYHTGLDFAAPIGTPVRAALAGTITHAGVRYETRAERIVLQDGAAVAVAATSGEIPAATVVLTTGAWLNQLVVDLGWRLPLAPFVAVRLTTAPAGVPATMPTFQGHHLGLWIRESAGGFTWGSTVAYAPAQRLAGSPLKNGPGPIRCAELMQRQHADTARIAEVFPALGDAPVIAELQGMPVYTPDHQFVIGQIPTCRNVWVAGGDNEAGISHAPGIGRLLTDMITGVEPICDPTPYRPDRLDPAAYPNEDRVGATLRGTLDEAFRRTGQPIR